MIYRSKACTQIKTGFQTGVTMIEALVALFVFSVGALGLAAMQTASLAQGDDSKQRALAIWKAQELADRIRSTKSVATPAGLGALYFAALGNNTADIGADNAARIFTAVGAGASVAANCAAPATRCADYRNPGGNLVAGAVCTDAQLVAFDIWDVMCEPNSGLTNSGLATTNDAIGSTGLLDVEIDLARNVNGAGVVEFTLFLEWVARASDTKREADVNLDGNTITTNLCGAPFDVDSNLDVYCLRFN